MSDTPYKDAFDAGIAIIGDTDPETGKVIKRVPTQAEVDQEERDRKTPAESLQEQREAMEVTPFMFKQALTRSGEKRGQVNAIIANPNTGDPIMDQDIKDGWDSASSIRRLDPLALYVQWRLGWTDEEADAVFILAETFRENR